MTETYFLNAADYTYTYTYYFSFGTFQIYSNSPIRELSNAFFYNPSYGELYADSGLQEAKNWFDKVLGTANYLSLKSGTDIIWQYGDCTNWRKNDALSTPMIDVWTYEYGGYSVLNLYDRSALGASPDPTPSASAAPSGTPGAQAEGVVVSSDISNKLDTISNGLGSLNLSVALLLTFIIFRSILNLRG